MTAFDPKLPLGTATLALLNRRAFHVAKDQGLVAISEEPFEWFAIALPFDSQNAEAFKRGRHCRSSQKPFQEATVAMLGRGREAYMWKWSPVALSLFVLSVPCLSQTIVAVAPHTSMVDGLIVTEGDISDRPYVELGKVTAKAGKFSLVSRNPDRSDIDRKLRERARQIGADAVIRVQYTPTGASMMSWGGIKGDGVAVKFSTASVPQQQQ